MELRITVTETAAAEGLMIIATGRDGKMVHEVRRVVPYSLLAVSQGGALKGERRKAVTDLVASVFTHA